MILKEGEENSMLFARLLDHKSNSSVHVHFGFPSAACWVTWFGRSWGGRAEAHEVHLARLSQANAAAGLGHKRGRPPVAPSTAVWWGPAKSPAVVGWSRAGVGQPIHSGMGWKNTWFHFCGPTTEGQRMCFLAAAPWPGLSSPYGPALTETQRIPPSFRTYPKANTGLILLQLSGCRSARPSGTLWNWRGGCQAGTGSVVPNRTFQERWQPSCCLGCCHILQGLWPSFSSSSH